MEAEQDLQEAPEATDHGGNPAEASSGQNGPAAEANGNSSLELRPVFLGNLVGNFTTADIAEIFQRPVNPPDTPEGSFSPIQVDHIDRKRGYCFVFLRAVNTEAEKEMVERFVNSIGGMNIPNVSNALRSEFARGDGKIKRKEDDRRRSIQPSETLFVVNFHEESTKREDLQMLFEPFGELVRIDMKRNYAFVQFRNVEDATRAKEVTNGGKLDQSVLTVEYVARQRGEGGDRRGGRDRRYNDRRGPARSPPDYRYQRGDRYDRGDRYERGDRYDRDDRYDDFRYRARDRSPGGYRGRRSSRSRSRSPPRYRSRSPPRGRYDDRGDRGGRYEDYPDRGGRRSPMDYRDRRSPDRDYRGGDREFRGDRDVRSDRDRGYRP